MKPPNRVRPGLSTQMLTEARGVLIRKLYREGLPGMFGPSPRPVGIGALVEILGVPRTSVARALAAEPEPEGEPTTGPERAPDEARAAS